MRMPATGALFFALALAAAPVFAQEGAEKKDAEHVHEGAKHEESKEGEGGGMEFWKWANFLVLAGAIFGLWVNRKIKDQHFVAVLYIITFMLGWYILFKGILQLRHEW